MNVVNLHDVDGKRKLVLLEGLCYFDDLTGEKGNENSVLFDSNNKKVLSCTETIDDIFLQLRPKKHSARTESSQPTDKVEFGEAKVKEKIKDFVQEVIVEQVESPVVESAVEEE